MVGQDELVEWFTHGFARCSKPNCKNVRIDIEPIAGIRAEPVSLQTEPVDDDEDMSMF